MFGMKYIFQIKKFIYIDEVEIKMSRILGNKSSAFPADLLSPVSGVDAGRNESNLSVSM